MGLTSISRLGTFFHHGTQNELLTLHYNTLVAKDPVVAKS